MSVKQVIVMRKDLNMRRGKQISQGAHASLKVFFDRMYTTNIDGQRCINLTSEECKWVDFEFTKICVSVNSEQELLDIYNKALTAKLNCSLIKDVGHTEFHGVATYTACAIGPNASEKIDLITGGLPLL